MIYLINGKQNIRLKSQMKSIVKKSLKEMDAMNFVKFDASLTPIQEIVSEANYMPLGYDSKAVIVDSPYFLLKEKGRNKIESEQDYESLKNYSLSVSQQKAYMEKLDFVCSIMEMDA